MIPVSLLFFFSFVPMTTLMVTAMRAAVYLSVAYTSELL